MSDYTTATSGLPFYSGTSFAELDKSDGGLSHAVGVYNACVLRANRRKGMGYTYNHAPDMTFFCGKFYVQYLANPINEHEGAGASFLSSSENGIDWSEPVLSFPPLLLPSGTNHCSDGRLVQIPENCYAVMHQRMAFYVSASGHLLTTGFYGYSPDHAVPWEHNGLGRVVREIYADGTMGNIYFIRPLYSSGWDRNKLPFPIYDDADDPDFISACNELLSDSLVTQQWAEEHGNNDSLISLKTRNEVFGAPRNRPYQAFTWYHINESTIIALWKQSIVGISYDNGQNWHIGREPSFVTSGGKAWGQKTGDSDFAIVYSASLSSEHRYPLAAAVSGDGLEFTELYSIFGETPLRRYDGLFKDFGPQYVRGISENCPERPTDAMWLCYSVNKEDIRVSRVALPIKHTADSHSLHLFGNDEYFSDWNIYSGKWAYIRSENGCMTLTDCDPCDCAKAELVFSEETAVELSVELCCEAYTEPFYIELTDDRSNVCARAQIMCGALYGRYTSVLNRLCDFETGFHTVTLRQNCKTCDCTVLYDGNTVGILRNMQKVNKVSRLILRTKAPANAPGMEKRPETPDIQGSEVKTDERKYYIKSVMTRKVEL